MLQVELACQMFHREAGQDGKTAWPIDLTEEQLTELMQIPGVWTPNTRKLDQMDGIAVWACRSLVLLVTVLQSWKRRKPWAYWLLQCLESDSECRRSWELRTIWTEDVNAESNEIELTEAVDKPSNPLFREEEVEVLVSNLGQENLLW